MEKSLQELQWDAEREELRAQRNMAHDLLANANGKIAALMAENAMLKAKLKEATPA